jgi:hypothetical protein
LFVWGLRFRSLKIKAKDNLLDAIAMSDTFKMPFISLSKQSEFRRDTDAEPHF